MGNFPNAWVSGKFTKYLDIWEISQNVCEFGKFFIFPKFLLESDGGVF